mgnify:CR=1 FL=1|jgi:hypothetical protein
MGLFDDILDTTVKVAGVTLSVAGGVAVNTVRGAAAAVGDAQEIVSGLTRLDLTPIENVADAGFPEPFPALNPRSKPPRRFSTNSAPVPWILTARS